MKSANTQPVVTLGSEPSAAGTAPPLGVRKKRGKIQATVYQRIRQGLMVGAFLPGQVITLRKLADALGTSPMPVREAIAQLVAANVLESLPNGSVAVPRVSKKRFIEITEVRKTLEGMAGATAASHASQALIGRLSVISDKLKRAIDAHNCLECLATNQEFHFSLYAAARSEVLLPFIEALWLQVGPLMYFSFSSPGIVWDAAAHDVILEGLRAHDPATVRKGIEKDIAVTAKSLIDAKVFDIQRMPTPFFYFGA